MEIQDKNFKEEVINSKKPVLLMFWGSWCPVCKRVQPMLKELKEEIDKEIKIKTMNIDRNPKASAEYKIAGTPTIYLFKNGEIKGMKVGAVSKRQLKDFIKERLKNKN